MDNPFEAPAEPSEAPRSAAHALRQEHLHAERHVRTLAFLQVAAGTYGLVIGLPVAALLAASEAPIGPALAAAVAAPGVVTFVVGRGLGRFAPWSRTAAILLVIPVAFLLPVGPWVAFRTVSILRSESGRLLFTDDDKHPRVSRSRCTVGLDGLWDLHRA